MWNHWHGLTDHLLVLPLPILLRLHQTILLIRRHLRICAACLRLPSWNSIRLLLGHIVLVVHVRLHSVALLRLPLLLSIPAWHLHLPSERVAVHAHLVVVSHGLLVPVQILLTLVSHARCR